MLTDTSERNDLYFAGVLANHMKVFELDDNLIEEARVEWTKLQEGKNV